MLRRTKSIQKRSDTLISRIPKVIPAAIRDKHIDLLSKIPSSLKSNELHAMEKIAEKIKKIENIEKGEKKYKREKVKLRNINLD